MIRLLLALLLLPSLAFAAEPSTYKPAFCDFEITFPEAPYRTQRCEGENNTQCYEQTSFTRVFIENNATVNFRVICNPINKDVKDTYSGEVMRSTLRAMTKRSVVDTFRTSFRESEQYKQAGLVGQGTAGRTTTLYIAQLWIGENSAFSVEAELIGDPTEKADQLFSDILKSAKFSEAETQEETTESPEPESAQP